MRIATSGVAAVPARSARREMERRWSLDVLMRDIEIPPVFP
jgi:hypothetical protein